MPGKNKGLEKREKGLALIAFGALAVAALVLFWPLGRNLVQGIVQAVYAGNSIGKTLAALSYFFVMPLATLFLIKTGLAGFLETRRVEKLAGIGFILVFCVGLLGGVVQLYQAKSFFDTGLPMAVMVQEGDRIGWEASREAHTHFPKTTVYYAESLLPFSISFKIDDGYPFYTVLPDVDAWSLFYLACLFLGIGLAMVYINSKARKVSTVDYFLFLAGSLGLAGALVDGGLAEATLTISIYFLLLFYARNYMRLGSLKESFYPLIALGLSLFLWPFGINLGVISYALPILGLVSAGYYFSMELKKGRPWFNVLNSFIALVLVLSLVSSTGYYLFYAFGKRVSGEKNLYVYGLPLESSPEEVREIISGYTEVREFSKTGWVAFANVDAEKSFRTHSLERELKERLEPESYLFVEGFDDNQRFAVMRVHWFRGVDPRKFLGQEFLDVEIVYLRHNPGNNTTDIVLETRTTEAWAMLSVLAEIRSKGFEGKLLVSKPEEKSF